MKAGQTSHNYASELGVSYEIDLWRKLSSAASAQEWEYKATQLDMETTRLALINNVVDSYFHLVYLSQAIRVTEQNIDFYTQLLQIINNQIHIRQGRCAGTPYCRKISAGCQKQPHEPGKQPQNGRTDLA